MIIEDIKFEDKTFRIVSLFFNIKWNSKKELKENVLNFVTDFDECLTL